MVKSPQQGHQLPYILAAFLDAHTLLLHEPTPASQAKPKQAEPRQAEPRLADMDQAESSLAEAPQAEVRAASQADVLSLTQVKLASKHAEL